jgi:hypothetical protein
MSVLSWEQPKKKMPKEEWLKITADSAPLGVYTPNMSKKDMLKWKAKHIKGKDERVEIRKSFHHTNGKKYPDHVVYSAQMVMIIRKEANDQPQVLISTNGKIGMSLETWLDTEAAVKEAFAVLTQK